ncbi:ABC transporter permease [Halanaerobium sp. ST460_2HS_T2]|uniref:ABC transporter permease n=1 Tax=Halanaerobium sp. ST460_2HS_T2 TaxID=2183914 RepID=UPI000DF1CCBF|nr:ABC transporter permease [Halanaerobium sp. ST460_2HS_T2]RCW55350.1 monosaccharide ABC transporter membrane protein (CUT2 family) [Halanaerobium sp. ST460_2HS_T2]
MIFNRKIKAKNKELFSLYTLVFLVILIPILISPQFRSKQNLINILNQLAPVGFVALGQTLVIITTGIDLSVGAVMSMTTAIAATQMNYGDMNSVIISIFYIFAAALFIGFINGLIISKLELEPLIVTLATGSIITGLTLLILPYPGGFCPNCFTDFLLYKVMDFLPLAFIYFLIIFFIVYLILSQTAFGRYIYSVGGSSKKSKLSGINVDKVLIKVYMMSAFLASLSGLSLAARMRSGDPLAGDSFTLMSVAAVLVGGTTFSGGRGGVLQTLAGVIILGVLSVILNIFGVSPFYQNVLTGMIIVAAVIYSSKKKNKEKG